MSADNAVILAAGCCSRFVPVCFDIPKGLIPIRGETLIERQIRQLHERRVFDITVVTGALAERFDCHLPHSSISCHRACGMLFPRLAEAKRAS